jgi:glycosyltransferase involved in cell wall biosynthesis
MRIGIDARLYSQTGVGTYIRNLIDKLQLLDKKNEYIIYLGSKDFDKISLKNPNWDKKILNIRWHSIKEQLLLPFFLRKDKLNLMHFPYFNVPVFYSGKYILTLHDLIIDHFDTGKASKLPYIFYKLKRLAYKLILFIAVKRASFILAISNATKIELQNHYHIQKEKIILTYEGIDEQYLHLLKNTIPKRFYEYPYILYVGNAYPHKNLEILIPVMKIILKRIKIKLVLVGNDDFFYPRLKKHVIQNNMSSSILFFGEADKTELVSLYIFAKCLVFPSLMEGFGLPCLEAIYANCLPVVSDIAVFRELWEESIDYFNMNDSKNIAETIMKVLKYSSSYYKDKIQSAQKRAKRFTWNKTASMIYKIYNL